MNLARHDFFRYFSGVNHLNTDNKTAVTLKIFQNNAIALIYYRGSNSLEAGGILLIFPLKSVIMSLHLRVPDFPQVEEIFDFIQDLEGVNARFQNNQLFVDIRVPGTDTFTGSAIFTPFMGMPNEPIFAFIKTAYGLIGNGE